MTLDRASGAVEHGNVADLPSLLLPGDLLVVNDTRVVPARLFGRDADGRRTEFLLVEKTEDAARLGLPREAGPAGRSRAGPSISERASRAS